jgi:hypothetical protein
MPVDVVESSTFPGKIQSIADGEPLDASHLIVAPAGLASRTRFLFDTLLGTGGSGVRRLRQAATLTALRAIAPADRASGDVCLVPGAGLYVFDATATGPERAPWLVVPGMPPGAWVNVLVALAGVASGLATLDATGKLAQPAGGQIVDVKFARLASVWGTPSTAWVDVPGLAVSVDARAGDRLLVDVTLIAFALGASGAYFRLVMRDASGDHEIDGSSRYVDGTTHGDAANAVTIAAPLVTRANIDGASSVVVQVQRTGTAGSANTSDRGCALRVALAR